MRRARALAAVLLALPVAAATVLATPASAAPRLTACKHPKGFACGSLLVPLDRAGNVPGAVRLHFAVQDSAKVRRRPLLIALTGGPGQSAISFAGSFRDSLAPMLERYRLLVFDQRGTGTSGALRCPALQKLGSLAPIGPERAGACGDLLGERRAFYATRDTVEDIEALRVALGAPKVALMGVSYGTFVAQQYARVHPATTDRLILDSVVGADGVDPFILDTFAITPRVLKEQCAHGRCAGATKDPVGDLAKLVARLQQGPVSGDVFDGRGRRHTVSYSSTGELANLIVAGDLNPFLQPAIPGAIAAALKGDPSELLRIRVVADGGKTKTSELSAGLFEATSCSDADLPYEISSPIADRPARIAAALDGIDPALYAPFDKAAVLAVSVAGDCAQWPAMQPTPPSSEPLPDVPALLLSGRLDMRTPLEGARRVAQELPRGSLVPVPGNGHDELDSDITGCTQTALKRFAAGRKVGDPCKGRTNQVDVFPVPPRGLSDYRRASGVPGDRGRAVLAIIDSVTDARVTALQRLVAELPDHAGGLHGGWMNVGETQLRLHRYTFVPGLRLTGTLYITSDGDTTGRLRVDGPGRLDGTVRLLGADIVQGRLGGRSVDFIPADTIVVSARAGRTPTLAQAARRLLRTAGERLRRLRAGDAVPVAR
jgi:pimeloyl-ACP methyl ester carboxylesterase